MCARESLAEQRRPVDRLGKPNELLATLFVEREFVQQQIRGAFLILVFRTERKKECPRLRARVQ